MKKPTEIDAPNLYMTLFDSIKDDTIDILSDSAEIGLDILMKEGILKEVPFLGLLTKTLNVGIAFKDCLFLSRLRNFLIDIQAIQLDVRTRFLKKNILKRKMIKENWVKN